MLDMFFKDNAVWFGIPAVLGAGLFLLRLIMMALGGHHGFEFHSDTGGDLHVGDGHHADTSNAFKLLTFQGVVAFIMGFGWAGLAAFHFAPTWSLIGDFAVAAGGGLLTTWLMALMMRTLMELQSSGTVEPTAAVGLQGTVYVGIAGDGSGGGQIQVVVEGRQRIYNAVSQGESLPTGTRVTVLSHNDNNTLTVARV